MQIDIAQINNLANNAIADLIAAEIILAERNFYEYVKLAWHVVCPAAPFIDGYHVGCIAEHLQAVTDGEITRLIINIFPRTGKSTEISVLWPTWEWGPRNMPYIKYLTCSYKEKLSVRDSLASRRLMQSPWYQNRWGERFCLTSDQNEKMRYDSNFLGYRIATSIKGGITGEGGDRVIMDDPHNVLQAESDTERLTVLTSWDEALNSRINDPKKSAKIIAHQRTHPNDLTGHILDSEADYVHVNLAIEHSKHYTYKMKTPLKKWMEFEGSREEGQLLWPEKFDREDVEKIKKETSQYAFQAQYCQDPKPRKGNLFNVENFEIWESMPPKSQIIKSVRYWDQASTEGAGKRTSGVLMHLLDDHETFVIQDCMKGHWGLVQRDKMIQFAAKLDGKGVRIYVEQEPGSAGVEAIYHKAKLLMGYFLKGDKVTGPKEVRAGIYATKVEYGFIKLIKGTWNRDFIEEHRLFPNYEFKDQVDSASGAFNILAAKKKRVGTF